MLSAFPSQFGAREATGFNCCLTQVVHEGGQLVASPRSNGLEGGPVPESGSLETGVVEMAYWGTP